MNALVPNRRTSGMRGADSTVPGTQGERAPVRERSAINVVVPAYKAESYIEKCLEGLFAAGFGRDEIIVIDDCSPDATREEVRKLGIEPIVLDRNRGAAAARNAGAAASEVDILLFVDCDVVVEPDVRERVEAFFIERPGYSAVFGSYDNAPECPSPVSRFRNLLHRHIHVEAEGEAVTFWTGCGAIRRDSFHSVGGFDCNQRMMEDVKLGLELHARGERIWLDPEIQGKHLKRWTLSSMFRTDMIHRAIPWTRLLRTEIGKASSYALNLSLRGRVSGIAVLGTVLGLPLLPLAPIAGIGMIAGSLTMLVIANRRFVRKLGNELGPFEAILAVPLLWLHYLSACLGYAYALWRR